MMSMNLAGLGFLLCQEFDLRKLELNKLHSEIRTKLITDRKELVKLRNVDRSDQQKARTQILEDTSSLLDKYRAERKTMEQVLKNDRVTQINEMKTWANERGEELKGWYEAGGYLLESV
jgi:hypothetical protein